jgi:hypothetical protein
LRLRAGAWGQSLEDSPGGRGERTGKLAFAVCPHPSREEKQSLSPWAGAVCPFAQPQQPWVRSREFSFSSGLGMVGRTSVRKGTCDRKTGFKRIKKTWAFSSSRLSCACARHRARPAVEKAWGQGAETSAAAWDGRARLIGEAQGPGGRQSLQGCLLRRSLEVA